MQKSRILINDVTRIKLEKIGLEHDIVLKSKIIDFLIDNYNTIYYENLGLKEFISILKIKGLHQKL